MERALIFVTSYFFVASVSRNWFVDEGMRIYDGGSLSAPLQGFRNAVPGGGDYYMKGAGMLVGNFEKIPKN